MRLRAGAIFVVASLGLACLGCGGTESERTPPLSPQRVRDAFRALTGDELNAAVSSPTFGYVFDDDVAEGRAFRRYENRYGHFTIYVITTDVQRRLGQVLRGLEPDGKGIYWRHITNQGRTFWLAMTKYGRNVVLTWFAPDDQRAVDQRWELLNRLLTKIARANVT